MGCLTFRATDFFLLELALTQLSTNILFAALLAKPVIAFKRNHSVDLELLEAHSAFVNSLIRELLVALSVLINELHLHAPDYLLPLGLNPPSSDSFLQPSLINKFITRPTLKLQKSIGIESIARKLKSFLLQAVEVHLMIALQSNLLTCTTIQKLFAHRTLQVAVEVKL